jgi:histidinol dehydrogenase
VIKQAKRMNYENQIRNSTNKIRITWNIIKSEVHKKDGKDNIQTLNIEGKTINNMKTVVEAFNNYFNKIADSIHKQIKEDGTNSKMISPIEQVGNYMTYISNAFGSPFPKLQIMKTTNTEVQRIIESLITSYTQGYHEISNNILKACKTYISAPLSYLCNRVLFEGIFQTG